MLGLAYYFFFFSPGPLPETKKVIDPVSRDLQNILTEAYRSLQDVEDGENADYIPELAKVPSDLYGIALITVDGDIYVEGDFDYIFSIQSISKPFTAALMMEDHSAEVLAEKIGVEPTGQPYDSVMAMEIMSIPSGNPLVNAGAIATVSYLEGKNPEEKFDRIISFYSELAGDELQILDNVYISEATTNYGNRGLAFLLEKHKLLGADPLESVDVYTRQCSIGVNSQQLAVMGATLANNGVNPLSGEEVIDKDHIPHILALMTMAGLYDQSGAWAYSVGVPTKTGVSGGVLAVVPGKMGIAVFSPPLNEAGNSVRGLQTLKLLGAEMDLNIFTRED